MSLWEFLQWTAAQTMIEEEERTKTARVAATQKSAISNNVAYKPLGGELFNCPDCGWRVSINAVSCPQCGFPISSEYIRFDGFYKEKPGPFQDIVETTSIFRFYPTGLYLWERRVPKGLSDKEIMHYLDDKKRQGYGYETTLPYGEFIDLGMEILSLSRDKVELLSGEDGITTFLFNPF